MKSKIICKQCYVRMLLWQRADVMAYIEESDDGADYGPLYERSVLLCRICTIRSKFRRLAGSILALWDLDFRASCTCDYCGEHDALIHRIVVREKMAGQG